MRGVLKAVGVLLLLSLGMGAVVLTASRLVEPAGLRWRQVEAFTPYGLLAWTLVLLVALVWLVRARRWRRLVPAVALLIGAAGLGAHVSWFLPQVTGPNAPPMAGAEPLVVMTANLQAGDGDAVDLVEAAVDQDVDLLVVQEVTPRALATMESAGLGQMLPYQAGEAADGTRGTMLFSRHELDSEEPLDTAMGTFSVAVTVDGEELTVAAVHLSPPVTDRWGPEHGLLAGWVRARQPDLVVGDFNATMDHRPMRELADAGYRSVTELANEGWRPTWPSDRLVPPWPMVQIDHVLCGGSMAAISSSTITLRGSDHRIVVAEVARK